MPIPLPIVRFLIRTGLAQRLPSIQRLTKGGAAYLRYYSDAVLMAPNTEVARTEAFFASRPDGCIDLSLGAPEFTLGPAPTAPEHLGNPSKPRAAFNGYPPPFGLPELREAVAHKLQRDNALHYAPGEVLITSGVCQAITMALDAFVNPGDTVVLFDPSFLIYQYALRWQRARIRWVPTRLEGGEIHFDARDLARALRGARMVIVNTPGNPTGGVIPESGLQAIVDLARRHDALIFSDEVYERFHYDGRRACSIASLPGARERTITANSLSKGYGLASLRVGYLATHAFLIRPLMATQFIRCPFVSTRCQRTAQHALSLPPETFAPVLEAFDRRRRLVHPFLRSCGMAIERPAGAFYYWIDVTRWAASGLDFARRLLEEQRVLLMPGEDFGPSGRRYVRLSFAVEEAELEEGLERLGAFLMSRTASRATHALAGRPHTSRESSRAPSRAAEPEKRSRLS